MTTDASRPYVWGKGSKRAIMQSDFITRVRFQLGVGFIFAIVMPALVRWLTIGSPPYIDTQQHTIVGSTIALILGYFCYKKLVIFPGIASGSYIIPVFTAAYAGIVVAFFFIRIDYSRLQFFLSYMCTIVWFVLLHGAALKRRRHRLAVIPGGDVDRLKDIGGVSWQLLVVPSDPVRDWDGVVADLRADPSDEWERMIAECALCGVPVYHVKQVVEQLTGRTEIAHLSENTLGSLNPNQAYIKIKEAVDWMCAAVVLIALLPLMLIVGLVIRLESPGPALFRQERVGFRGKSFMVYKFRTMAETVVAPKESDRAADSDDPVLDERLRAMTLPDDPRITKFGRLLRKTRIDELPQIINVLRGEMSWIGPRPEARPLTLWYEAELPFYHYRHIVRPGLTGWAQVCQGHVADVHEVREKLQYDFYYINNFSFWLDVLIALRTVRIVLTGHGAR